MAPLKVNAEPPRCSTANPSVFIVERKSSHSTVFPPSSIPLLRSGNISAITWNGIELCLSVYSTGGGFSVSPVSSSMTRSAKAAAYLACRLTDTERVSRRVLIFSFASAWI